MGFGGFLKNAINPLRLVKNVGKNVAQGDWKNLALNTVVGPATLGMGPSWSRNGGGRPPGWLPPAAAVSSEAQNFFDTFNPADQQNIMAGFGNRPDLQGWYEAARAAGAVPGLNNLAMSAVPQVDTSMFATGRREPMSFRDLGQIFQQQPRPAAAPLPAPPQERGPQISNWGGPLPGLMAQLTQLPIQLPQPPQDLNAEYERLKAERGAGYARQWMAQQQ